MLARTRQMNKNKCMSSVPELEKLRASTLLGVPAAEGPGGAELMGVHECSAGGRGRGILHGES